MELTYYQKYYRKNRDKIIQQKREWRENNPEKWKSINRKSFKKHYLKNREKVLNKNKKWIENNKEKIQHRKKKSREKYLRQWFQIIKEHYGEIKCQKCGYNKIFRNLEFHHRNPKTKELYISSIIGKKPTPERILELEKCDLLCKICHGEIHDSDSGSSIQRIYEESI